jgi:hypothetical protein
MTGACSHERWAFLQALNPPPCPPKSCPLQIRPPIKLRACHAGYACRACLKVHEMSGETSSTKDVFILPTHNRIFDDIGTDNTVQSLADNLLKSFIFIASVVCGQFRGHFNSKAVHNYNTSR